MRRMSPAEFNAAMIHFYRGEVQRSNTWRNRLDTTTNWAVITAGATLSFVFSSPNNPHFVIPINSILVAIFLLMEAAPGKGNATLGKGHERRTGRDCGQI
jgi:uncharacterized membrane protein